MRNMLGRLLGDEALGREASERGDAAAAERSRRVREAATQDFEEIDRRFGVVGHTAPAGRSSSRYPELRRRELKRRAGQTAPPGR